MFGNKNNYLFDLIIKDIADKGKENLYEIKTKIKTFDFEKLFNNSSLTGATKTDTVAGVYSYQIEAPGFSKDAIDINLKEGRLTIKAKSANRELNYDIFIGEDTISKVTLELGILEIKLNEVKTKEKSTKINID